MTALEARFRAAFGAPPAFAVTAPGRVNLIGEHIDYAGLAVLPMALQHRVRALVRPRDDGTVRLTNTDAAFEPREYRLDPDAPPWPAGDWGNYAKAATCHCEPRYGPLRGFDAAFTSTLPIASGLSSSSALVVAAARCALAAAERDVPLLELAEGLAEAERYVGTRGGGMDQAVCLAAREGTALRVGFGPLRVEPVPVPSEWRFVVASSLVRAEKSAGMRAEYNLRREQVEEALAAVGRVLGGARAGAPSYPDLLSRHEVADLLEVGGRVLRDVALCRFRHVVTEAGRVDGAVAAMRSGDLGGFGALMTASHASLRDDFAVSRAELDAIVEIACAAGAAGARLTGAGFGGCAVILCRADRAPKVLLALTEQFYAGRCAPDALGDALFVAEPSAGASVTAMTPDS